MRALTKEEYIAKKNKLEKKHNDWLIKNNKKREELLNSIIESGTNYFIRWINHIDTFEEPREKVVLITEISFISFFETIANAKIAKYDFQPDEFSPMLKKLIEAFPYLDIEARYCAGLFGIKVSLKKE